MFNEQGTCPKCGSNNIDYMGSIIDGDTLVYKCICEDCNQYYHEVYNVEFSHNAVDVLVNRTSISNN